MESEGTTNQEQDGKYLIAVTESRNLQILLLNRNLNRNLNRSMKPEPENLKPETSEISDQIARCTTPAARYYFAA